MLETAKYHLRGYRRCLAHLPYASRLLTAPTPVPPMFGAQGYRDVTLTEAASNIAGAGNGGGASVEKE